MSTIVFFFSSKKGVTTLSLFKKQPPFWRDEGAVKTE